MSKRKKKNIYQKASRLFSGTDKALLTSHLKDKGHKLPKNWRVIHSEFCGDDELKTDVSPLLVKLGRDLKKDENFKFFVPIVSNPNKESSLDTGQFRVRYRYGIALSNSGEPLIKDNTREFCETLVRARKIYRREDINIMSFRGANPIAKRNYSIFNLKGHWNCRHAWIREVFVIERDPSETENNPIVEKTTLMKNKKVSAAILKFKESTKGENLTAKEIIAVTEQMLSEQKFADEKVGDQILRIDGEIAEGTAVSWVDEEGELTDVPDGEVILEDGRTLIIKGGVIAEVKEVDGEEDVEETELSKDAKPLTKADVTSIVTEVLKTGLVAHSKEIDEKIAEIPAFGKQKIASKFTASITEDNKNPTIKRRPNLNDSFKRPGEEA